MYYACQYKLLHSTQPSDECKFKLILLRSLSVRVYFRFVTVILCMQIVAYIEAIEILYIFVELRSNEIISLEKVFVVYDLWHQRIINCYTAQIPYISFPSPLAASSRIQIVHIIRIGKNHSPESCHRLTFSCFVFNFLVKIRQQQRRHTSLSIRLMLLLL